MMRSGCETEEDGDGGWASEREGQSEGGGGGDMMDLL